MGKIDIDIKLVRDGAQMPKYATNGSAAADLHAVLQSPCTILPGENAILPTGVSIALPSEEYVALVFARSGLGIKHGITLSNGVGVIDSDYRGEICVGLVNLSKEAYTIQNGERIAQLCIMPVFIANFALKEELENTNRGEGGFGSTGR